jgi:hypothetical protein
MPTITTAGFIPTPPATLNATIISDAQALSPGLTANLPGSLIEDLASTATGAVVVQDQGIVDLGNSIAPPFANPPVLYQLGMQYGVPQGQGSNTSVYVTFLSSNYGFVINAGFVVSDGTNQYIVQDGGAISASGQSQPLYCLAVNPGSWAVPIGTVIQIVTSLPTGITMTCTNTTSGLPGETTQSLESYQAQVIQAGQAVAQGFPQFLKTQLQNVSGVQSNLISLTAVGSNWKIICGGGDPYQVANAIYQGMFDFNNLVGSTILAASITSVYAPVVTTNLNHGYSSGQVMQLVGAAGGSWGTDTSGINFIAAVTTETTFTLNVAIASIAWASGTVTVTTTEPHNLPSGTTAGNIYGCTPTAYNGAYTLTRTGANTFTYPLASNPGTATNLGYTPYDGSGNGTYTTNSAYITPNLRNIVVSINDYPDTYSIPFVIPPAQQVSVALTWNSIATNYVSATAVAAAGAPALDSYINGIGVGQPINIYDMQAAFKKSIATLLDITLISQMTFVVTINGIVTSPVAGTGVIYGDPESYFQTTVAAITITQV